MKRIISIILIQAFFITNIGISASDINRSSLRRQVEAKQRIIYTRTLKQPEIVNFKGELLINDKLSDSQKEEVKAHGLNHILSFYLIKHKRDVWDKIEKIFTRDWQWKYLLRELVRLRVDLPHNHKDIDTLSKKELEKILRKDREFGNKHKKRPSNKTNRVETNWVVEILGLWAQYSCRMSLRAEGGAISPLAAPVIASLKGEAIPLGNKEFVRGVNELVAANEELFKEAGYITDEKSVIASGARQSASGGKQSSWTGNGIASASSRNDGSFAVYSQSHLEELTRGLDAAGVGEMARCWTMEAKNKIREKLRNGDEIDREEIKKYLSKEYATFDLNDEEFDKIIAAESDKISDLQDRLTELLVKSLEEHELGDLDYEGVDSHDISEAVLNDLILKEIIPKVNRKRLGEISEDELIKDIAGKLKEKLFYDIDEVTEYILEGVIRENPEILESISLLKSSIEKLMAFHKKDSDGPDDDDTGASAGAAGKGKSASGDTRFKNTFGAGKDSKGKTFFGVIKGKWENYFTMSLQAIAKQFRWTLLSLRGQSPKQSRWIETNGIASSLSLASLGVIPRNDIFRRSIFIPQNFRYIMAAAVMAKFALAYFGILPQADQGEISLFAAGIPFIPLTTAPASNDTSGDTQELPSYLEDFTKRYADEIKENPELGKRDADPAMFREREIIEIIRTLRQTQTANSFLLGETGVGKTAIVEGLAWRIVRKATNQSWLDKFRILKLEPSTFLAIYGASVDTYNAGIEELKRIASEKETIIFIDEAHLLSDLYGGSPQGFFEGLKPVMARGKVKLICATTTEEQRDYFEKNKALMRRFTKVNTKALNTREATEVAKRSRSRIEEAQNKDTDNPNEEIRIAADAPASAVGLTDRGIPQTPQIGKTIDLLERAAARKRTQLGEIKSLIETRKYDIVQYISDLRDAIEYEDKELKTEAAAQLEEAVDVLIGLKEKGDNGISYTVTRQDLIEVLADMGVQLDELDEDSAEKLKGLKAYLKQNLKGQDHIINPVVSAISRRYVYKDRKNPIASIAALGPTGVGKTELFRLLARYFFGGEDKIVRIDCEQLKEEHAAQAFLGGAPPGYVGYGAKTLADRINEKGGSCLLLFDEIEKVHPNTLQSLLKVIGEEGTFTDLAGKSASLKNIIIGFTSNIGIPIGWQDNMNVEQLKQEIKDAWEVWTSPEFRNRLDVTLYYNPMDEDTARDALRNVLLPKVQERYLREHKIELEFNHTLQKGFGIYGLSATVHQELRDVCGIEIAESGDIYLLTERGIERIKAESKESEILYSAGEDDMLFVSFSRNRESGKEIIMLTDQMGEHYVFDVVSKELTSAEEKTEDAREILKKSLQFRGLIVKLFNDRSLEISSAEETAEEREDIIDIVVNAEGTELYLLTANGNILIFAEGLGIKSGISLEDKESAQSIAVDKEGRILVGTKSGIAYYEETAVDPIIELLLKEGYSKEYGARRLTRGVKELIDTEMVKLLPKLSKGDVVHIRAQGGVFEFEIRKSSEDISKIVLKSSTEKSRELLNKITAKIDSLDEEAPFTEEDLERLLDEKPANFRRDKGFAADEELKMPQDFDTVIFGEYIPGKRDGELIDMINSLKTELEIYESVYSKIIPDIIRKLTAAAKEDALNKTAHPLAGMLFNRIKNKRWRKEIIEENKERKPVKLQWALEGEAFYCTITHPSYISKERAEAIITNFGHNLTSETEIDRLDNNITNKRLASARLVISANRGKSGYSRDKGRLWFTMPVEKSAVSPVIASPPKADEAILRQIQQLKQEIEQRRGRTGGIDIARISEARWEKIAEDQGGLGYEVEKIAIDKETGKIYAATYNRRNIVIMSEDGKIEDEIDVGEDTYACAVTSKHIFAATKYGLYVYKKQKENGQWVLDRAIGEEGIIQKDKWILGVAVQEKEGRYEVFVSDWKNNKLLKYADNDYTKPVTEKDMKDPRGLSIGSDGNLLMAYSDRAAILDADSLDILSDMGDMGDLLNGAIAIVEQGGVYLVTGYNSDKTLLFEKTEEIIGDTDIKKLRKIDGALENSRVKKPTGIAKAANGDIIISAEGAGGKPSSIWRITLPRKELSEAEGDGIASVPPRNDGSDGTPTNPEPRKPSAGVTPVRVSDDVAESI